jgi:hypothetical protein
LVPDITWGALKFDDSVTRTNFSFYNRQDELNNINQVKFSEITAMQKVYDNESESGRKEKAQLAWQRKIKTIQKENLP